MTEPAPLDYSVWMDWGKHSMVHLACRPQSGKETR